MIRINSRVLDAAIRQDTLDYCKHFLLLKCLLVDRHTEIKHVVGTRYRPQPGGRDIHPDYDRGGLTW